MTPPVHDLPDRLRSEMITYTALDLAPDDLAERVWRLSARRRRRQTVAAGSVAAVLILAVVSLVGPQSPSSSPDRLAAHNAKPDVSLLSLGERFRGSISVETSPGGVLERVELPAYIRNNGSEPIRLLEMSIVGTALGESFEERILAPGGRQPLSFVQVLDCSRQATPPADPQLQLRVRTSAGDQVLTLDVPKEVLAMYRLAHGCSDESLRSAREAAQERAGQQVPSTDRPAASDD